MITKKINSHHLKNVQRPKFLSRRYVFISAVAFCVVVLVACGLLYQVRIHLQAVVNTKVIPSTQPTPNTNISTTVKNTPGPTPGQSSPPPDSSIPSTPPTTANILTSAPSGTFVSNHYPNLNGKPRPSQEQSTCNTVPGASCYIEFTNSNGQVKMLPTQTADSSGTTMWNWDVNTAGFTAGEWQIKAVVTLQGTTKSTTDSLKLDVQP